MTKTAEQSPVFIVGAVRSGTTLFRLMLGHHPHVEIFGEFEEAVSLLTENGWVDLVEYRAHLLTDRAALAHGFTIDVSLDYPALVRNFLDQVRAQTEKPIVGASIHSRFDRCPDLWPDARYIHVLRDPRDVASSCVKMGWAGTAYHGVRYWIEAERRWDRLIRKTPPERHFEIRYEQLVHEPESVLSGVCRFLDIEYHASMLNYDTDTTYGRPDSRLVEQWRTSLSPREIQQIEWRCGSILSARGFVHSDYAPRAPGLGERLQLIVENCTQRALFAIRKYGLVLWATERLARVAGPAQLRSRIQLRKNEIDRVHLR